MKRQSKYNVIVTVILMCFASLSANAFFVDGLEYAILPGGDRTVAVCKGRYGGIEGELEIPKEIIYESITYTVTSIEDYAFYGCSGLTSVAIPNSVTKIGEQAFNGCRGLTSVMIGNSVTSIGMLAFYDCRGLTSVTIPNSVTLIDSSAFLNCSGLTSVTIGSSVATIGNSAFSSCHGLTSVTIPNSVTVIGERAFLNCSGLTEINVDAENPNFASEDGILYTKDKISVILCPMRKKGEIVMPNSVTMIGNSAFYGCRGLTSVTIGNSVTSIGDDAFYGCRGLISVEIPNSVTSIGDYAFSDCSGLTSVKIPNSVILIDEGTFNGCSGLTSVEIPNSVIWIGEYAFSKCSGLKSVYCHWAEPLKCSPNFPEEVVRYAVLYVPKGYMRLYEKVDPWRDFWNIEELEYSGVDTVAGDGVEVKVVDGAVVAYGCDEMEVYSMNGQLVYRGSGRADNLVPGIYAVRVGGKTVKVMVGR